MLLIASSRAPSSHVKALVRLSYQHLALITLNAHTFNLNRVDVKPVTIREVLPATSAHVQVNSTAKLQGSAGLLETDSIGRSQSALSNCCYTYQALKETKKRRCDAK
jgi:hypothetical protein